MIIFGSKGRITTKKRDLFYCPTCQSEKTYEWKLVRNWFTLYFIPVIPLGLKGEYIECTTCLRTYSIDVIEHYDKIKNANAEFLSEFHKAIREIMIMIMLADGIIDPNEKKTIQTIYFQISGDEYPADKLDDDIIRIKNEQLSIDYYIDTISGKLNEQGKILVIQSAVIISLSDGLLDNKETIMMKKIAKKFELNENIIEDIITNFK